MGTRHPLDTQPGWSCWLSGPLERVWGNEVVVAPALITAGEAVSCNAVLSVTGDQYTNLFFIWVQVRSLGRIFRE
jgi:hypothetical protein